MAFIYNLTDSWNDVTTTWNGIKLAVTDTGSSSTSKLLNLTISGSSSGYFYVDKTGNLTLSGSVNKITMTAPATGATLTLADNSTHVTVGAFSSTFTFTGTTTLTFPTSGTVTALGNTTTGSGSIVLATSPTLVSPALGTPTALTLTNATGLPISTGLTGTGSGVLTALAVNVGSAGAFVTFNGALGTPSSGNLSNCSGYPSGSLSGLGTGVATALAQNVGNAGAIVVQNGVLGTPSSGTLTNCSGLSLTSGVTGTLPVANGGTGITSFGTGVATALGVNVGSAGAFVVNGGALGTPSSGTLTNATGLPISTGVSGLGPGVATFLATPSSANLASAVTDETGSGPLVFATSPTFTSQVTLGTQSTTRGTLVLANTTAGSKAVTLQSSNSTAAAYTLTLPAAAPVNGYYLQTDNLGNLSWAAGGGGGGGSPGGSNTQVQFNDAATFGGAAAFTYDKTTYTLGLGVASTTTGIFNLYNSLSANAVSIKSGNNSAAWSLTLPTSGGSANYFLQTDGSGNTTWAAAAAGTINTGTVGQITYYSGTNTLSGTTTGTGVLTALGVNTGTAGAFVVNGGALGTPLTGTLTNCTGLPVSTGISGLGTGVATALANNTNIAGGVLVPAAALTANALVVGGGSGTGPSTVTTGTGVVTALGVNTGSAGAFVVNGGALGTPSSGTLTNCTGIPAAGITGTLGVANGGTGLTSLTAGYIPYGNGTSAFNNSANLTYSGTVLTAVGEIYASQAATNTQQIRLSPQSSGSNIIYSTYAGTNSYLPLVFNVGGSDRLTIDTSGNLGLGVTPSAWGLASSGYRAVEVGAAGNGIYAATDEVDFLCNAYYNGGWKYGAAASTKATKYYQGGGQHQWSTAGNGTAGNAITFTQAMTLDANGCLGVGTTPASAAYRLDVYSATDVYGRFFSGGTNTTTVFYLTNGNGTTSAKYNYFRFLNNDTNGQDWRLGTYGDNNFTIYDGKASSARLTIDTSGNVLVGGTAARGTTVGTAHLDIFNGTAPAGTLTNGISLYSSSGDFNFMDASGNGYKVGFRNIPQNSQGGAYTLVAGDVGKHISISTGGVTCNASVFSAGDVFTIYNNSGSNQTITAGTNVTFRLAGTATTGNRTLAQYGTATLLCVTGGATPTFVVSGGGVT